MSVLFIGSIYPTGEIEKLKRMGSDIDFAAETFQTSLLRGLCHYYPELKVITAPCVSTYPRIRKMKFAQGLFSLPFSSSAHVTISFVNLPGIKHLSKCFSVWRSIRNALDEGGDNVIIIYAVHSPFLLALCGIHRKRFKSCLIVPDLPEYMSDNRNILYRIGKRIDSWLIRMGLRRVDGFALFSPYMREKLPIGSKPYTLTEGIYCDTMPPVMIEKSANKILLYTGNLGRRYGIVDLLEAFHRIDKPDYQLCICGAGDGAEDVMRYAKEDSRIHYLGILPRTEVIKLQRQSTLLVNPRHSADSYTKYSFPSKTMEYMASGTPTLMSHLASIPKEYESHLFFFDDESVEGMRDKIVEVCERPKAELDAFGRAASDFIRAEKNEEKVAGKVVDLINRI